MTKVGAVAAAHTEGAVKAPRLLVFSTLFPHPGQPQAGLFIRERMFRVGRELPLIVVAPVPWFPLQGLIRLFRPHFRPAAPRHESQQGFEVLHPRFLCVPGIAKRLDGLLLALSCWWCLRKLRRRFAFDLIDAHFAYPDGYAATLLGRWFRVPVTITLRGTEARHARNRVLAPKLREALHAAARVFSVSQSLQNLALAQGVPDNRTQVVGNGVDTDRFIGIDRQEARVRLGLPDDARILITVGALVERKGFHRVLEILPALHTRFPSLHYLIVGGASAEGDWRSRLEAQVAEAGLADCVHFLGALPADSLSLPLSAADVFVLPTRNEGWANVILEAMACGLPVITTDVGGNAEVVTGPELGQIVPFGDRDALEHTVAEALERDWDRRRIRQYAEAHHWDRKISALVEAFRELI
jgi:glycosyltransferase involved in cell wall biosynthesis